MESKRDKRIRVGISILPEIITLADNNIKNANCGSRSELIENAIQFYIGYIMSDKNTEFLSTAISKTVQGIIANTEKRLSTLAFKQAVASMKMSKILALFIDLDKQQEEQINLEALRETKKINGTIPFE